MGKLLDKYNKNKFSIYDSEEKTVLKIIENINVFNKEVAEEVENKTDKFGNHLGSWQGLNKPTMSEEGMRATVENLSENIIPTQTLKINKAEENINVITSDYLKVNVKDYGAKGDGVTDDTQSIINAKNYAVTNNKSLYFPKGVYCYTSLGKLNYKGFKIIGSADKEVTLKCINENEGHYAFDLDNFANNEVNPILQGYEIKNIIIECNGRAIKGVHIQGVSNMDVENVYVKGLGGTDTVAFHLKGVHTSTFKNLSHSHNLTGVESVRPTTGLLIDRSTRNGTVEGSSTNNNFISCYFENCETGIELLYSDQNNFISGASQGNVYGVKIQNGGRMSNFIGFATERNSSKIDIDDIGKLNNFQNCYTQYTMKQNGLQGSVIGGKISNLIVGGEGGFVTNVRVNNVGNDDGGFVLGGKGNIVHSVLDLNTSVNKMIYPLKDRKAITVTETPFIYTNETGSLIEVIIEGGTVTEVKKTRNGSSCGVANSSPTTQLLAPTESLRISYTEKPSVSYLEYNGY